MLRVGNHMILKSHARNMLDFYFFIWMQEECLKHQKGSTVNRLSNPLETVKKTGISANSATSSVTTLCCASALYWDHGSGSSSRHT